MYLKNRLHLWALILMLNAHSFFFVIVKFYNIYVQITK